MGSWEAELRGWLGGARSVLSEPMRYGASRDSLGAYHSRRGSGGSGGGGGGVSRSASVASAGSGGGDAPGAATALEAAPSEFSDSTYDGERPPPPLRDATGRLHPPGTGLPSEWSEHTVQFAPGLRSTKALLKSSRGDRAAYVVALTGGGALRAVRRRYARLAAYLVSLPPSLGLTSSHHPFLPSLAGTRASPPTWSPSCPPPSRPMGARAAVRGRRTRRASGSSRARCSWPRRPRAASPRAAARSPPRPPPPRPPPPPPPPLPPPPPPPLPRACCRASSCASATRCCSGSWGPPRPAAPSMPSSTRPLSAARSSSPTLRRSATRRPPSSSW